jgi:hypothetical protein
MNANTLRIAAGFALYAPEDEVTAMVEELAHAPNAADTFGHFLADCTDSSAGLEREEVVTGLLLAAASMQ